MSDIFEKFKPSIGVFGVGGAGLNAINEMIFSQLENVVFIAANTDAQSLSHSVATNKIQLGIKQTKGLGAGANPEVGKISAEENINEIRDKLKDLDMVFISAGLGGGTGTGAAPIIAKEAKSLDILTIAIVTKPFEFEGEKRMQIANNGLMELEKYADALIVIPNDNLIKFSNKDTGLLDAFRKANNILLACVRSFCELLLKLGLINRDFADVKTVMSGMGRAMIGYGEENGEDRHIKIIDKICKNEITEINSIDGAKKALINITGNDKMTIFEIQYIMSEIRKKIDPEADVVFGAVFDSECENIKVTIICTGIQQEDKKSFFKKKDFNNFEYNKIKQNDHENSMKFEEKLLAEDISYEFHNNEYNFLNYENNTHINNDNIDNNTISLYDILKNDLKSQERTIHEEPKIDEEKNIINNINVFQFSDKIEKLKLFQVLKNEKDLIETEEELIKSNEERKFFFRPKNENIIEEKNVSEININSNKLNSVNINNKNDKQKMPLFDSLYSSLIKNLKDDAFEFINGPSAEIEEDRKKNNKVA